MLVPVRASPVPSVARGSFVLGSARFASRTPSVFRFPFFSTGPSLFLSIFPGKLRGNRQILGSEPSLRLVWAQNQPNFRPNRQNAAGILRRPVHTWNLPCDRLGILSISSILPQILPQTSSQTQGKQRVSRMEHQTPSVCPGNFRKRKGQSAGDPLFSFLFSGKLCSPAQARPRAL